MSARREFRSRFWSERLALSALVFCAQACEPSVRVVEPAPRSVIVSDEFVQTVYWGRGQDEDWIRVFNRVLEPEGTWDRVEHIYHVPFDIQAVDGRQSDEFYVAGRLTTGEDVIERWRLSPNPGDYFFRVELSASPIGIAVPPLPGTSHGIVGGGAYVSSASRRVTPELERLELYRGSAFGGVVDLSSDPEGRFVIVLGKRPSALYRLTIAAGAVPTVLYTISDLPLLAHAESMHRRQHPSDGRTYILRGDAGFPLGEFHLAVFDRDNDGEFEGTRELYDSEYKSGVWLADFTTYASTR